MTAPTPTAPRLSINPREDLHREIIIRLRLLRIINFGGQGFIISNISQVDKRGREVRARRRQSSSSRNKENDVLRRRTLTMEEERKENDILEQLGAQQRQSSAARIKMRQK